MTLFAPLECHHPYPQAIRLSLVLRGSAREEQGLEGHLTHQPTAIALPQGQVRFQVRGGRWQLHLQGIEGRVPEGLTPGLTSLGATATSLGYHVTLAAGLPLASPLVTLPLGEDPWLVQSIFTVPPEEITIVGTQGLWPADLTPNHWGIGDRLLAQFLARECFLPALAWGQWGYGSPAWQALYSPPMDGLSPEALTRLGDRLQRLTQCETKDLGVLAQEGELDLHQDLAGGKFVGADLRGLDLSGADLRDCNFRGALLTDIDLSGADLRGCNFRGADLSGAYLENADLRNADLRKSSLALANLIGANLQGADLQGATLSNANFSAAHLEQARLGDNGGLSPDQLQGFLDRGAQSVPEMLS